MNNKLLINIRRWIIQKRAKWDSPVVGFKLSDLVASFKWSKNFQMKKLNRGHFQACLAILATEGLVYTRRKPENIGWENHEIDKFFKIRISQKQALKMLSKMKD